MGFRSHVLEPHGRFRFLCFFLLVVLLNAPAIITQPVGQMVSLGQSASFTVVATGSPFLSYQWSQDGTDIGGATNASYAIVPVQTNDAGNYRVLVTNLYGSKLSSDAMLTIGTLDHFTWSLILAPWLTNVPFTASVSRTAAPDTQHDGSGGAEAGLPRRQGCSSDRCASPRGFSEERDARQPPPTRRTAGRMPTPIRITTPLNTVRDMPPAYQLR